MFRQNLKIFLFIIILLFFSSCRGGYGRYNNKEDILSAISNLASADFSTKIQAQNFLVQNGKDYISLFVEYLKDDNRDVREGTVWVLGELRAREAVEPLIEVLNTDDDWVVRSYAAIALGQIGDPFAVESLIKVLKSKSIENVMASSSSAQALGEIGDDRATMPLINSLNNISIRSNAIEALGKIGNPVAMPFLWEIFVREEDPETLEQLEVALICLRSKEEVYIEDLGSGEAEKRKKAEEVFISMGDYSFDPLFEALNDDNPKVRLGAARLLGQFSDSSSAGPLYAALEKEKDPVVKKEILKIIEDLQSSVQNWIKELGSNDLAKKQEAVDAIMAVGKDAVFPLISALDNTNKAETAAIVEILGNIGDKKACGALIDLLAVDDPLIHYLSMESLIKLGEVEPLFDAADRKEPLVRAGVCEVLGALKSEESINLLLDSLEFDDSEEVKRSASIALSHIASPKTVGPLIYMLYYSDATTTIYAIEALRDMGAEESLDGLMANLYNKDPLVRAKAAEAIGEIGNTEELPGLEGAFNGEENIYVREKLSTAIEKLKQKERI